MSSFQRTKQWLVFSRQWWLLDAKWQDASKLGEKIAKYLKGAHKPIFHPTSDCGDHVIVYNTRHIAMKAFDWKHREYFFHNRYMDGNVWYPAWEIHQHQPTRILWMEVYNHLENDHTRRNFIERLHLFPENEIPAELMRNVSGQMEQIQVVPKRLDEYKKEEKERFPALFEFPKDYVVDPGDK